MKAMGDTGLPLRCERCIEKVQQECQRQITQGQQQVQEIDMHLLSVAMQRARISVQDRTLVYGQLRMIKREMQNVHLMSELEEWCIKNEEDYKSFKGFFHDMATIKD